MVVSLVSKMAFLWNSHSPIPEPERFFCGKGTCYMYQNNPLYRTPNRRPPCQRRADWLEAGCKLCKGTVPYMDEGTLKTPTPFCRFHWSFCLGWWSNSVGSVSGQKQSVKFLQNMVYTAQFTPLPPPRDTHWLYILYIYYGKGGRGEGEVREKVEGQQ